MSRIASQLRVDGVRGEFRLFRVRIQRNRILDSVVILADTPRQCQ
jgi:hypothetical protein